MRLHMLIDIFEFTSVVDDIFTVYLQQSAASTNMWYNFLSRMWRIFIWYYKHNFSTEMYNRYIYKRYDMYMFGKLFFFVSHGRLLSKNICPFGLWHRYTNRSIIMQTMLNIEKYSRHPPSLCRCVIADLISLWRGKDHITSLRWSRCGISDNICVLSIVNE